MTPEQRRVVRRETEHRNVEQEMQREQQSTFGGAVLQWVHALTKKEGSRTPCPPPLDRGAAFVPAVLMSIMTGCHASRVVECTKSERDFLNASVDWMSEHPDEIDTHMDELWPNHSLSGQELIHTLSAAVIECGVDRGTKNVGHFATTRHNKNTIVVTVDTHYFLNALDHYEQGAWTQDMSLDDVIDVLKETGKEAVLNDRSSYMQSMFYYAYVLGHEAAHLALGSHTQETKAQIQALHEKYGNAIPPESIEQIDEIYAWGNAAKNAGTEEWSDEIDAMIRAEYPVAFK